MTQSENHSIYQIAGRTLGNDMGVAQSEKLAKRPWLAAALWMLFLGPFFFLVWGLCNWITSLRSDVGTFYFGWEKSIPFVPWMIIPYMSIDLFFAGSTFLCSTKAELNTLVKRIIFAIFISAAGFLLFPLRLGYVRPETSPTFDQSFDLLAFLIGDFNLFPSLHISLRWIIWDVYRRHTRGLLKIFLGAWFVLIALSTVLGYQHHVIDVIGGDMVAILSFYLFREPNPSVKDSGLLDQPQKNVRVGWNYAMLSLLSFLLAYTGWPWSIILIWPALALAIIASAYFGVGPSIFRKTRGRLPFSAVALLGPYLLGAYLSSLYYRRLSQPYCDVAAGIVLGRKLGEHEAQEAIRHGVTAVLDLTAEYAECHRFLLLPYLNFQILDLTVPSLSQLQEAVEFTRKHSGTGKVYVHCSLGYSRSACAVAAYLLADGTAPTVEKALEIIRRERPEIVLKDNWISVLRAYQDQKANFRASV